MLKLADKTDKEKIESFCSLHPLGVRIACQMSAYGFDYDFLKIWFSSDGENINAVISSFYGNATLCADDSADFAEIGTFASAVGIETMCAQSEAFALCGFREAKRKIMFKYTGFEKNTCEGVGNHAELKSVYELISRCIPSAFPNEKDAYLSFASDFTFRQRRSYARMKAFTVGEQVLSCAVTAAESKQAALISGVACDEAARGKGLGKKTVLALADELSKEGKTVYVIALNDSAAAFYEKIGFERCLTVSYMQ